MGVNLRQIVSPETISLEKLKGKKNRRLKRLEEESKILY